MLNTVNQALWVIVSVIIFLCGIYFSFKLKFIHLNFKRMFQSITQKSNKKESISSFQALTMSLAGRIGVGSLSGIALAVFLGGPGVLFWIWMTSLFCAVLAFVESVLAVTFRHKDTGNIYRGGPFYYIMEGLGNKKLSLIYAVIILISYVCGFSTMQINTMSKCINQVTNIEPWVVGVVCAVLTGLVIFGGVKKIASTTSKIIPIMTFFYLSICLYIIIANFPMIKIVFEEIISSAFNFKAIGGGFIVTLLIGMQKGIFSSEVGLGTGSIAAVTADTENAAINGLVQVFGVHVENLIFATLTTFAVCMSNYSNLVIPDANGIEITLYAFQYHIGNLGNIFITITISLFAFSTIIAGYYYGESSLKFIRNATKLDTLMLKIITLCMLVVGSVISSNLLWSVVDVLVGTIALVNVYALFKLRKIVVEEYMEYKRCQ
ncbi:MAG: alanine:cation symporter family protein [Oscillospiraceae bacterium]|nr:alanine:cation symporter family protein [Oscillospiraceae bacterium]